MSCASKVSSEKASISKTSKEQGVWLSTEEVRYAKPPSSTHPTQPPSSTLPLSNNPADLVTIAVFGPGATLWYKFLQKRIVLKSENATIAARVLVDQTVFASTNLFLFLSSMAVMEGSDPKEKLDNSYWNALQKNWMVWPAVQAINFKLVPLEHRVLVVNIVSLGESLPLLHRGVSMGNDVGNCILISCVQGGIATLAISTARRNDAIQLEKVKPSSFMIPFCVCQK